MTKMEELLFASPCIEFESAIRTASKAEKEQLRSLAYSQARTLAPHFLANTVHGDGPKAGTYAHDLAERYLLLCDEPADFAPMAEILELTCSMLPHLKAETFKEQGLPLPICGVVGLASDLFRLMPKKFHAVIGNPKPRMPELFGLGALVCAAGAIWALLHPAAPVLLDGKPVCYLLALVLAAGCAALLVFYSRGLKKKEAHRRVKKAASLLLEDAEEARDYFALCLRRVEAYHKWLEGKRGTSYKKAETAEQYYRSALNWGARFVNTFR